MTGFLKVFVLSAPLFAIVFVGYLIALQRRWRPGWTAFASKFVFLVALPALLFHMMSDLSSLPPVDARLLVAFFGGCFLVFALGRIVAARVFHLDAVSQSVFALGGVFSNNVLLGLPLAKLTLGEAAAPSVALVLVFNSLTLWTLVTVSVEWARRGAFTLAGFGKTALSVARNPIVAAILTGTLVGLAGWRLPRWIDAPLAGPQSARRAGRAAYAWHGPRQLRRTQGVARERRDMCAQAPGAAACRLVARGSNRPARARNERGRAARVNVSRRKRLPDGCAVRCSAEHRREQSGAVDGPCGRYDADLAIAAAGAGFVGGASSERLTAATQSAH
jgi:hypothetical protein